MPLTAETPRTSVRSVLRRGAAAGAIAGAASGLVMAFLVEPVIAAALRVEAARAGADHEEVFSRPVQVAGGLVSAVVVAVAVGVVFSLVLARFGHLLPASSGSGRAMVLALIGFAVFALLPAVAYPANPPGVGDAATVGARSAVYGMLLLAGTAVAVGVLALHRVMRRRRWPARRRAPGVAAAVVVALAVVLLVFPSPPRVPPDVAAELVWDFRVRSLAQLAALWGVMGLAMGWLLGAQDDDDAPTQPGVLIR